MQEMQVLELYAAAATAAINERCAPAYLHDVRGTLHALGSSFELLERIARSGAGDMERVEKACELARRAINRHEQTTLETMQLLTLRSTPPATLDVAALLRDAGHFLRNEAASHSIRLTVDAATELFARADRTKLRTLLLGLLLAAIDTQTPGSSLIVSLAVHDGGGELSIGSPLGFSTTPIAPQIGDSEPNLPLRDPDLSLGDLGLPLRDLVAYFALQYLPRIGGSLTIDAAAPPGRTLIVFSAPPPNPSREG